MFIFEFEGVIKGWVLKLDGVGLWSVRVVVSVFV